MPGDHVIVGDLVETPNSAENLRAPIFVRVPYVRNLNAVHIRTLHNNNNFSFRQSRCYILLPNGSFLMASLEPNFHAIRHYSRTVILVNLPEYNNNLYSGVLDSGRGRFPFPS